MKKNGFVDLLNRIGFKTDGLVPEKYRIRKTIITLNRNNLEYSLGNVRFYSDVDYFEVNIVDDKTTEYNINSKEDNKNIYNYIIEGDPVSNSSKHVGVTTRLPKTAINNHSIANYLDMWA